jgi:hypothetical protein
MHAYEMGNILLANLVVALRDRGIEPTCSTALYHGDSVTLDYADCGGMAWVRLVTSGPSQNFPNVTQGVAACAMTLAHTFEIGVMRAAPLARALLADSGIDLPDDEENSEAAELALKDMEAMWAAIQASTTDIELMAPGTYTPVGPVGGALGGTWSVTVGDDD